MAESRTTKKRYHKRDPNQALKQQADTRAVAEVTANIMARFLDHWTRNEVEALGRNEPVLCIELEKGVYRIGKFFIAQHNSELWQVDNEHGEFVHQFYSKQAAVFYCLYDTRHKYNQARELLFGDKRLFSLKTQIDQYYVLLKKAIERKDEWRQDLYIARLSHTRPLFADARDRLQKTITYAKYSKIWENRK
jgi:hypothetical protein